MSDFSSNSCCYLIGGGKYIALPWITQFPVLDYVVQDETQALTSKNEDLEGTQKELDAALAYFDKPIYLEYHGKFQGSKRQLSFTPYKNRVD